MNINQMKIIFGIALIVVFIVFIMTSKNTSKKLREFLLMRIKEKMISKI